MRALNRFRIVFFIILISTGIYLEINSILEKEKKNHPPAEKVEEDIVKEENNIEFNITQMKD